MGNDNSDPKRSQLDKQEKADTRTPPGYINSVTKMQFEPRTEKPNTRFQRFKQNEIEDT